MLANSVDVQTVIRSNIYFPTYSNSLKDLGRHLGHAWTVPEASGLQSLVWRQRWEKSHDEKHKDCLVVYNAEDCAALKHLVDHIQAIAKNFDREVGKSQRMWTCEQWKR